MRLTNFIITICGSLTLSFIFGMYLYKFGIKNIERQTKIILGLLMLFSTIHLVSNSIKFSLRLNLLDSNNGYLVQSLTSVGLLALFLMAAIQFFFVKEMGEVYIKIRSENPLDSARQLRLIKIKFIVVYVAEFIAFILRLVMQFEGEALQNHSTIDKILKVIFVISISTIIILAVPQMIKHYMFFAKLKLQQLKSSQKMTFKRLQFFILPFFVSILYLAYCILLIAEVVIQFANENVQYKLEVAEIRKTYLLIVLSFNAIAIMILIYCVGKNQQKKNLKKKLPKKSNNTVSINKNKETIEVGSWGDKQSE